MNIVAHRPALNPSVNSLIPLRFRIVAWLAFVGWAGTIWFFSSLSGSEIQNIDLHFWDKAQHFIAFLVGGVILALALRWTVTWPWKKLAPTAFLLLVIFGALDEYHQTFTPNRTGADVADWIADCLGALAGVGLVVVTYARFQRPHRPASAGA